MFAWWAMIWLAFDLAGMPRFMVDPLGCPIFDGQTYHYIRKD
jgi:hypothetical protein